MIHDKRIPKIEMIHLRRRDKLKRPAEKRGKFNVDSSRSMKKGPSKCSQYNTPKEILGV